MEILTLGNKVQRTGSFIPEWLALSIAWLIALTWASSVENVYAQQYQPAFDAQPAYQLMQPSQGPPGAWTEPAEAQNPIRLVQSTSNYDKPLHPMIEKMPDIEDELEVIHHRSQLIVARSNVLRTAISDTSVIDVVPYSPNEIAILGLNRGSTTLTVWFEDNPDPVVFLVKVVRDPSLEEQRRVD
ncbi:MAG: pilus assembly protein N-terminal domain-containing protein, partial [Planctomycetaceae bacterium]